MMIQIREVKVVPYSPSKFGLLQAKRRRTRIRFVVGRRGAGSYRHEQMERQLRPLLTEVQERMTVSPYVPTPLPEHLKIEWNDEERAFVMRSGPHEKPLAGFEVVVQLEEQDDRADGSPELTEGSTVALYGSPLPRMQG